MNITVVIPFHRGDRVIARSLMQWIGELGGCRPHHLLLVPDSGVEPAAVAEIEAAGVGLFSGVQTVTVHVPDGHSGWPKGPNHVFQFIAGYIGSNYRTPWLLLEPDCVPLCEGWLDALVSEYESVPEKFMGVVVNNRGRSDMPPFHMNGTSLYSQDAHHWIKNIGHLDPEKAFDVAIGERVLPACHHTELIHNHWGDFGHPPLVVESVNTASPGHHFPVTAIRADAVLFHRDKTHSLIPILRKRRLRVRDVPVPGSNEGKA
jgi:hypothetical protein